MKTKSARQRATGTESPTRGFSAVGNAAPAPKPSWEKEPPIPPQWRWHYRTLLRLRSHLMQDTAKKLHEVADPVEGHSLDNADSATDEFDHVLALALLAREENALTEVNDAITRILEGRYGVCGKTGARIPARRLRAIPWCRYARAVEAELEKTGTFTDARIPAAVSVRGWKKHLPGAGGTYREGMDGEPPEETLPGEGGVMRDLVTPEPDFARDDGAGRGVSPDEAR